MTYLHADHLGSTLLATDGQGNVVGGNQPRYFAYGRERTPSLAALPTDYTYTGQKQDGSGLVYMNARYYDPQIGQFISPDALVLDLSNLLDYNRYLYSYDNPIKFSDSTGHFAVCFQGSTAKQVDPKSTIQFNSLAAFASGKAENVNGTMGTPLYPWPPVCKTDGACPLLRSGFTGEPANFVQN